MFAATRTMPKRPDHTILNEAIPLYCVGQNKAGRWVVRESNGRGLGIFRDQLSAMRFARTQSGLCGCAVMLVSDGLELEEAPRV